MGFRELLVDQNPATTELAPLFRFVTSNALNPLPAIERDSRYCDLPVGTRFEFSWPSYTTITQVAKLLQSEGGGAGLVIDYGDDRLFSNSFRVRSNVSPSINLSDANRYLGHPRTPYSRCIR